MVFRATAALLLCLPLLQGCSRTASSSSSKVPARRAGPKPETLAVYEAWFGHPRHMRIAYSSHDPAVIRKQIQQAKSLGISGFVLDWYGYREPFINQSYALMQSIAAEEHFHVAMMYDEIDDEDGATDETIEDLKLFNKTYLAPAAPGRPSYLTYGERPVIFIFPKGRHTDWGRVRTEVDKWNRPPVLINEYPPDSFLPAIDGYYAWISPGNKGWAADGTNWGADYLDEFYDTMQTKHPEKIAVGAAWASFDDSKASWGLNRHISARCGQTLTDTVNLWRKHFASYYMPYLLIETWNDHEEGTGIEFGKFRCDAGKQLPLLQ